MVNEVYRQTVSQGKNINKERKHMVPWETLTPEYSHACVPFTQQTLSTYSVLSTLIGMGAQSQGTLGPDWEELGSHDARLTSTEEQQFYLGTQAGRFAVDGDTPGWRRGSTQAWRALWLVNSESSPLESKLHGIESCFFTTDSAVTEQHVISADCEGLKIEAGWEKGLKWGWEAEEDLDSRRYQTTVLREWDWTSTSQKRFELRSLKPGRKIS